MNIGIFSESFSKELVADYDRRNLKRREGRGRRKKPPRTVSGGGGCDCKEVWVFLPIDPTAGTWDIDLTVNGSNETLTFDYNTSLSAFETELATHTELTVASFVASGGPFPNVAIYVDWTSPLDDDIKNNFPTVDVSLLTGSVTMYKHSRAK